MRKETKVGTRKTERARESTRERLNLLCVKETVVRYSPTGIGHHCSLTKPTSSQEKTLRESGEKMRDKRRERQSEGERERESKAQTALSLTAILHSFHIISSLITHRLSFPLKNTHTTGESAVWATVQRPR